MRLWSIHPKYLDTAGLVAVWREGLLAKAVLQNKTRGYKNHPQLERFKLSKNPIAAINKYLEAIYKEATIRGFHFDKRKLDITVSKVKIKVSSGQIKYEFEHLKKKLKKRSPKIFANIKTVKRIAVHPSFTTYKGPVELWEHQSFDKIRPLSFKKRQNKKLLHGTII